MLFKPFSTIKLAYKALMKNNAQVYMYSIQVG